MSLPIMQRLLQEHRTTEQPKPETVYRSAKTKSKIETEEIAAEPEPEPESEIKPEETED